MNKENVFIDKEYYSAIKKDKYEALTGKWMQPDNVKWNKTCKLIYHIVSLVWESEIYTHGEKEGK